MTTDTSRTIEIRGRALNNLGLAGAGVLMTLVSAALAFGWLEDQGVINRLYGWFGLLFFGLCTVVLAVRAVTMTGVVLTISPQGIRDTRVSADLVPWSAVREISTWSYGAENVLVLRVDPAVEKRLRLSLIARWSRGPNRALGADGLAITARGIKIDYDTLYQTAIDYWGAAGGIYRP